MRSCGTVSALAPMGKDTVRVATRSSFSFLGSS